MGTAQGTRAKAQTNDAAVSVESELVTAPVAAKICGISIAGWWRHNAAGKIPAPVRLVGRRLWRRQELHDWITAGCPPRREWEAIRKAKAGR